MAAFHHRGSLLLLCSALISAMGQHVTTRILPTDQIVLNEEDLEPQGQGAGSEGRAVVWCLVQDLDPDNNILSLELFFKMAPQVRTGPDEEEDLFTGSFKSQLGVPGAEAQAGRASESKNSPNGPAQSLGKGRPRGPEGFPEAQMTNVNTSSDQQISDKTDAANEHQAYQKGTEEPATRLDNRCALPGCSTVARVVGSGSAKLGVQHVQRSGVSVRGVISAANPNLSSLQVSIQRATCNDCGTYMCVLRYQNTLGNVTEAQSENDLIVAQSITHRLNVKIRRNTTEADSSGKENVTPGSSSASYSPPSSSSSGSLASFSRAHDGPASSAATAAAITDLVCFGTVSNPSIPFVWSRRRHPSRDFNVTARSTLELMRHGKPQLGQDCQYWRLSALRHVWDASDDTWLMFGCYLAPDNSLAASALISVEGPLVTASCGDPHSTLPLTQNDSHVTVVCDVSLRLNVTTLSWQHADKEQGRCDVTTRNSANGRETSWSCLTSLRRYSAGTNARNQFVLTIDLYDVSQDQGQWKCVVTPLDVDFAALCVLG